MVIYSHRGESKYAPENTMSAFYLAYLLNSEGIECDIRKTKDNKLVLLHDKTINRTSSGKGNVSEYTLNELKEFDFGNKKFNNEKIITLDEFLKNFSDKNINIYLEIKEGGYEKQIWDTISKYNIKKITVISFKYEILKKFRILTKTLNLGWLVYDITDDYIKKAINIKIKILLCLSSTLDKRNIKEAKDNNIQIGAWGVKNKAELKRLNKLNIDTLVYDSYYDAKKELKNE